MNHYVKISLTIIGFSAFGSFVDLAILYPDVTLYQRLSHDLVHVLLGGEIMRLAIRQSEEKKK